MKKAHRVSEVDKCSVANHDSNVDASSLMVQFLTDDSAKVAALKAQLTAIEEELTAMHLVETCMMRTLVVMKRSHACLGAELEAELGAGGEHRAVMKVYNGIVSTGYNELMRTHVAIYHTPLHVISITCS